MGFRSAIAASAWILIVSAPAAAEAFHLGAAYSQASLSSSGFADRLAEVSGPGSLPNYLSGDARMVQKSGGTFLAGWTPAPWLAIEVDYLRAGTIATSYAISSTRGISFSRVATRQRLDGLGVSVLGSARLAEALSIIGRVGVVRTRLEFERETCSSSIAVPQPTVFCIDATEPTLRQTKPVAGLALGYRASNRVSIRAGWNRYFGVGKPFTADQADDALGRFDVDLFSVGAIYRF